MQTVHALSNLASSLEGIAWASAAHKSIEGLICRLTEVATGLLADPVKAADPAPATLFHTMEEDFQHFLAYSGMGNLLAAEVIDHVRTAFAENWVPHSPIPTAAQNPADAPVGGVQVPAAAVEVPEAVPEPVASAVIGVPTVAETVPAALDGTSPTDEPAPAPVLAEAVSPTEPAPVLVPEMAAPWTVVEALSLPADVSPAPEPEVPAPAPVDTVAPTDQPAPPVTEAVAPEVPAEVPTPQYP
jgi:hypothetical protein